MSLSFINACVNYISTSIPPGPQYIKMKQIINFQKGSTFFYVLFLMMYYDNFTMTSYLYLALHGTYGFLWLLKDKIFPDGSWERKSTILSSLACFGLVLGPYWVAPYLLIRDGVEISLIKMYLCIVMHTFGCVIMMSSDTQKYFVLKENKKLINDGWFKNIRNPNYLGEMMIYGTYAFMGVSFLPYIILMYIWSILFYPNMKLKENSIKKKNGGDEYIKSSNLLFPSLNLFKTNNKKYN